MKHWVLGLSLCMYQHSHGERWVHNACWVAVSMYQQTCWVLYVILGMYQCYEALGAWIVIVHVPTLSR